MPQPLPLGRDISFNFTQDAVSKRPKLAHHIVSVCMRWNEIESRLAIFLAALMGGEAKTIVSVFLALRTDRGKKATLDTVAELKLSPNELAEFRDIQEEIGKRYGDRNKAVHGSWGVSPEYPDDLLWYDARTSIAMFPELMNHLGPAKTAKRKKIIEEQKRNIRIYTEKDLIDVNSRLQATYKRLEKFTDRFCQSIFDNIKV